MRRGAALLAVLALVALAGCARRERANPFDPENTGTEGRPAGFVALAGNGRVDLRWQPVSGSGLAGYLVYRRVPPDSLYRPLSGRLPAFSERYADLNLVNGVNHAYRLVYVFDDGTISAPAEDLATPGRVVVWVADALAGRLARVTPDGRRVADSRGGYASPGATAIDTLTGRVWVSDAGLAQVRIFDPASGVTVSVPLSGTPGDIAVAHGAATAWVCDETGDVVRRLTEAGTTAVTLTGFSTPAGVAFDPADGSLWICDRGGDAVEHRDPDLGVVSRTGFSRPSRVARDAASGEVWATSFTAGAVARIAADGTLQQTLTGYAGPVGIAVDSRRGRIWIADALADRVVALDRVGATEFTVGGLPGVRAVAVDHETGEAWVACAFSGEVVRLSPAGAVLRRLAAFGSATAIAVDPLGGVYVPPAPSALTAADR